ncbi:universal stress protein [Acidianus sp. RZ1]|uniref:universal stress protein n=1 Tax=Acidianus sp. RZ1 TaxID=1540082 RepID=UPI001490985E|nr:universal stress protein [Acidianus sp. RZ1]NON62711.1 universal stress protein [Acidianus sp. RZ1]
MVKRILVGFDGSNVSMKALLFGIKIAKNRNGDVLVLEVIESPIKYGLENYQLEDHRIREKVVIHEELMKRLSVEHDVPIYFKIDRGYPPHVIAKYADKENVDLVVVGTRGIKGLKKIFVESVSTKVIETVKKPILIVK